MISEPGSPSATDVRALVPELAGDSKADLFLSWDGGRVCVILRGMTTGATVRFVREPCAAEVTSAGKDLRVEWEEP